jgi:hypothetical protein
LLNFITPADKIWIEFASVCPNETFMFHKKTRYTKPHRSRWILEAEMKTTQRVTLSIPKDILRKARILAVQKNTSLSGLLVQILTEIVSRQADYDQARLRSLSQLKSGFDLATQGKAIWKREELHEC